MKTKFAVNNKTGEVLEQTPDADWRVKMDAWSACRLARKCFAHHTAVPAPMPWGHVMFDTRSKSGTHTPANVAPVPVWTDGVGALYAGQPVSWEGQPNFRGAAPHWMYGVVVAFEDRLLVIRRHDGGICTLDPYRLA